MSHNYTPDEVTFALYFDNELDREEELRFEAALQDDPKLLAQYNLWAETYERVYEHFETLEANYALEGFTERVMAELPQEAPWEKRSGESAPREEIKRESQWFKRFFIPILIGSLTAAVIVFALTRQDQLVSSPTEVTSPRPETQLITHTVTWLESDEEDDANEENEENEEFDDEDDGI